MRKLDNNQGFTIVELLIATMIFATILLIVTVGIIQVSRVYYKGQTESNVQDTTRTALDTITQAIQFNGGTVTATVTPAAIGQAKTFCVGNVQFTYILGYELVTTPPPLPPHQTNQSLLMNTGVTNCPTAAPATTGRELLGTDMRLSNLQVAQVPGSKNVWTVSMSVVYGDDTLLSNPTAQNANCLDQAGGQFCSTSSLTTTVVKRVQ